jgi:hypothetical protein
VEDCDLANFIRNERGFHRKPDGRTEKIFITADERARLFLASRALGVPMRCLMTIAVQRLLADYERDMSAAARTAPTPHPVSRSVGSGRSGSLCADPAANEARAA